MYWLSRVGSDSLGRYIRHTLEAEGIDCSYVAEDGNRATGLMLKERAQLGADPKIEYFRQASAASHLSPVDADAIDFKTIQHVHATGIPPALSTSCRDLSWRILEKARAAGASISFDPNLRPSLWKSEADMRDTLNAMAFHADWVLPGLAEGQKLTGRDTPEGIADFYLERGVRAVILKLGPEGAFFRGCIEGEAETFTTPAQTVPEVVDTVGAGDGFAVGVVSALLENLGPRAAVRRGNIIGAQAVKVRGDMEGLPDRVRLGELERL